MHYNRRKFVKQVSQLTLGASFFGIACTNNNTQTTAIEEVKEVINKAPFFKLSLAEWSLHKMIFDGQLDHLDFAKKTKSYGIEAVEYVNQFFKDKAQDMDYLKDMKMRADDNGVKSLLIMVDGEGHLGDTNDANRTKAIENHYKWIDAAKFLGCHSIRVNAAGEGTAEEVGQAAIDGLGRLSEYAAKEGLNVLVENHGGYSSDGKWLSGVMKSVNKNNCGTLPDFGNFCVRRVGGHPWEGECEIEYDRYMGVQELMPYAKAVSAKSHDFDKNGNEIHTDFTKIMQIVKNAGYNGYVGIEYEGSELSEEEGILATKQLLDKIAATLS